MFAKTLLKNFRKARPKFEVPQDVLLGWLARAHLQAKIYQEGRDISVADVANKEIEKMQKFVSRFACDAKRISSRGIQTDDAYESDYQKMQIYKITPTANSGLAMLARSQFFSKACNEIFEQFYPLASSAPEHIIHVTCTGYVSPSGAQHIVAQRNWNSQTAVTHAYHMGCYASLPALRMAQAISMSLPKKPADQAHEVSGVFGQAQIDIAHTELCSLHLNPADHSPEQIVVQSLFADGSIKYSVTHEETCVDAIQDSQSSQNLRSFEIFKIKEFIIPHTEKMMTWITADHGMQMTLAKEVPEQVAKHLIAFLKDFGLDFVGDTNLSTKADAIADVSHRRVPRLDSKTCLFAIHPGGPRILDSIQDLLKISNDQIFHSKQVLFKYGNMSSATLPHIWQEILEDPSVDSGTNVMSLAFGPGLTIFGGLLKKL